MPGAFVKQRALEAKPKAKERCPSDLLTLLMKCKRPVDFREAKVKKGGCLGPGWWPPRPGLLQRQGWNRQGRAGRQPPMPACTHAAEQ